jgi:Uma2 family endonuclease
MPELHRFSVEDYHRLYELGIVKETDYVELIEGHLVLQRRPRSPLHCRTLSLVWNDLRAMLPVGWDVRVHSGATLSDSEPEPDLAIVRDGQDDYMRHHPGPDDIAAIIEVADWTLALDRADKCRIYARAGIPVYWIVNLVDNQIEVYTSPVGDPTPGYRDRIDRHAGDDIDVILDGRRVGSVSVAAVFA